jgi:two-component system NtrC family sensor kinase
MNFKTRSLIYLLAGFLLLTGLNASAQKKDQKHIDSLRKALSTAKADTSKVKILGKLGNAYLKTAQLDSVYFYSQPGLKLSEKLNWIKGTAQAYHRMGDYYFHKSDFATAQKYFLHAVDLYFTIKDYYDASRAADYGATALLYQKKTPESVSYLKSIAERYKKLGRHKELANAYLLIASYNGNLFNYGTAIDYYNKARALEETDHRQYLNGYSLATVAYIYIHLHSTDKARAILQRSESMFKKAGDQNGLGYNYMAVAEAYNADHNYKAAVPNYKKAEKIGKMTEYTDMQSSAENSASWDYYLLKDYETAYTYAQLAMASAKDSIDRSYALSTLGPVYRDAPPSLIHKFGLTPGQQFQKAVELTKQAVDFGRTHGDFNLYIQNLKELSTTYEKMGRYADAFKTYKTYITQKDSTDSLTNEKAIVLKEAEKDYNHKEDSLRFQQSITSTQLKQKKQQSYFFIGGIAALLVLSVFIWLNFNNQRKSNKLLAQANDQITSANHELNERREEITAQRDQLADTITDLKAAQQQLIQSEKMASLGELTAGIAHEIQNPLNFVNNFSEVNTELIDELQTELERGDLEEVKNIAADIQENEKKINMHGKRADSIVKGMLEHSRASTGQKELTDLNKLADEYLRLAYHGLRAKDKAFNAGLITNFAESLPLVNVIPQDIGRVLFNLFNNAFYAVYQKQKSVDVDYKPTVEISTATNHGQVQIIVKDNGPGIPENIKDKIMQPFFTTKPTGEGTGLGLSLSYDIVVKGHGGNIALNSKEGEGAEFTITLPIT